MIRMSAAAAARRRSARAVVHKRALRCFLYTLRSAHRKRRLPHLSRRGGALRRLFDHPLDVLEGCAAQGHNRRRCFRPGVQAAETPACQQGGLSSRLLDLTVLFRRRGLLDLLLDLLELCLHLSQLHVLLLHEPATKKVGTGNVNKLPRTDDPSTERC